MSDMVPLESLAGAFVESGERAAAVAERLGWFTHQGYPDGPRVRRALGLRGEYIGRADGAYTRRRRAHYETAVRLASAIGVDPVEVGL